LLMAPEATLPPSDVNVPGDYFSLAGFEVTMYGRFWVTPEANLFGYLRICDFKILASRTGIEPVSPP
jgi:hypothetical protein